VACRFIHCLRASFHDHFLAGTDQPRTLFSNAAQSGIELFLGLDSSGKVAAQAYCSDTLPINDSMKFRDGIAKTCFTSVKVRAELGDRHSFLVSRLTTL